MAFLQMESRPSCLYCGISESYKPVYRNFRVNYNLEKSNLESKKPYRGFETTASKRCYFSHNFRSEVFYVSRPSGDRIKNKSSTYLFRTVNGGQVKVVVGKKDTEEHIVYIEVSSLQLDVKYDKLVLSWGIFRSDSSSYTENLMETPFVQSTMGNFTHELKFESKQGIFYLSFVLISCSDDDPSRLEIKSHKNTRFCVPVGFSSGCPTPLGNSYSDDGSMNFSIFSKNAESVVLCLYDKRSADIPALELDLDPYVNRFGDIWHASMSSEVPFVSYGYRFKKDGFYLKRVVLDPYAKIIENFKSNSLGLLCKGVNFDWTGDVRPCLPIEKLVVYHLNVARFTKDESSNLPTNVAGSFSGITEKLQHFKDIGVNCVLLEPIFPFDEQKGPYFPSHFFSPTDLYGPSRVPESTICSLKEMVKKLHANGIEVFMEVVFTHTEALREIDDSCYYLKHVESDGTRNILNCNKPVVQQMIIDSLRHWVVEYRIDGFCFINSSSLTRDFQGETLSRPPLIEWIAFDPILSKTKIISDSWDPHEPGLQKDIKFPHWKRWAEMNSKFCHDVRKFMKGDGVLSEFSTRLCGSGDVFSGGRGPAFSFNYVTKNSGLTLLDLVSFSGRGGNLSWNCGEEGASNNTLVLETRVKHIRNYLFILFISLGVPILNMGDECGESVGGSVEYNGRRALNWGAIKTAFGVQTKEFVSFLASLRGRRCDIFERTDFFKVENIVWHGTDKCAPRWDDPTTKFLAVTLKAESQTRGDIFMMFNGGDVCERVILPAPLVGMLWVRLVDTGVPYPGFFSTECDFVVKEIDGHFTYQLSSHSCALFEATSLKSA